jgi:hypothetical protein
MATIVRKHNLRKELGIDADRCPTFRTQFSFDQQKDLIDEDVYAAKSVITLLCVLVASGLVLGASAVLIMAMLR